MVPPASPGVNDLSTNGGRNLLYKYKRQGPGRGRCAGRAADPVSSPGLRVVTFRQPTRKVGMGKHFRDIPALSGHDSCYPPPLPPLLGSFRASAGSASRRPSCYVLLSERLRPPNPSRLSWPTFPAKRAFPPRLGVSGGGGDSETPKAAVMKPRAPRFRNPEEDAAPGRGLAAGGVWP